MKKLLFLAIFVTFGSNCFAMNSNTEQENIKVPTLELLLDNTKQCKEIINTWHARIFSEKKQRKKFIFNFFKKDNSSEKKLSDIINILKKELLTITDENQKKDFQKSIFNLGLIHENLLNPILLEKNKLFLGGTKCYFVEFESQGL